MQQNSDDLSSSGWKLRRGLRIAAVAVVLLAAGSVARGILSRHSQDVAVAEWTNQAAIPTVHVVNPKVGDSHQQIGLPGDVQAWFESPIYARVNGYLRAWYFDFGAHVKKGDVLADIETPELDAQLAAARATLDARKADVKVKEAEQRFAETTYARWRDSPKGSVSVQEQQAKRADYESAVARLNAAKANTEIAQAEVNRLQALEGFKRLLAPFDGTVTARNTDIGALINAGSGMGGGSAPELFKVADTHKMRIFMKVPQLLTAGIVPGLKAEVRLPQYPNKVFHAVVATTSRAVNVASRTLVVELQADNADGLLEPGTYSQVSLKIPGTEPVLLVPTSALLFREHGLEVAVVTADNRIALKRISVGRNLGVEVEVVDGLTATDRVVTSPPASIGKGDLVNVASNNASAAR
ncbi:MAG TPA: efflux RND transporter periplasmic adaptor subunit [Hyphomicrobium sp.]|nr:efflux RND transporter periplasmic adaptor subunit [Hyphomicrobium sp.]